MKQYKLNRTLLGEEITVLILQFDRDVHVSVYGGHRPHIGAVSIGSEDGCATTQFPGHKEGIVSSQWCTALLDAGFEHVVTEAGIHYDSLTPAGIQAVLDLNDELLIEAIPLLTTGEKT